MPAAQPQPSACSEPLSEPEIRAYFDTICQNGATVDLHELSTELWWLTVASKSASEATIEEATGQDGSHVVTYAQFVALIRSREAVLRDIFNLIDTDKSGDLQEVELSRALNSSGMSFTHEQMHKIYKLADANHDGRISFAEFERMFALLPGHELRRLADMWRSLSYHMYVDVPARTHAQHPLLVTVGAGLVAGAVSRSLTAPFDRLSLVLRAGGTVHAEAAAGAGSAGGIVATLKSMVRSGGYRSLWRGNGTNVVQVGPESALTFLLYEQLKRNLVSDAAKPTASEKFLCGAGAGAIAMTAVYPMYVVQARMAVAERGVYGGMVDCFRQTWRLEGGLRGLTRGYLPSLVRIVPYKGGDLMVFETLKAWFVPEGSKVSVPQSLVFGAAASCVSQTLTYPLALARTKLQAQGKASGRPELYSGTIDCLRKTVSGSPSQGLPALGVAGLYRGCGAYLLKMVPAIAVQFSVYERARQLLEQRWG